MVKTPDPKEQQTWRTFLRNHIDVSAGDDFFPVPTLAFRLLYVFVVLSHDRRRILHVNVTKPPHRDRDSIYGELVRRRIKSIGMAEVVSAKQLPWQNSYVERVIGSIRRECTDHLVPLNESHLRKILGEYFECYNRVRCHQSLDGNAPEPRQVHDGDGSVYAIPHVGGLHREYRRAG